MGLAARGGWGDTVVDVGSGLVADLIGRRTYQGGALRLDEVLSDYPVALLVREGSRS